MIILSKFTPALLFQAFKTAAAVGSALLLINQYDAILGEAPRRLLPAALTYCVPFLVLLYGNLSKKP